MLRAWTYSKGSADLVRRQGRHRNWSDVQVAKAGRRMQAGVTDAEIPSQLKLHPAPSAAAWGRLGLAAVQGRLDGGRLPAGPGREGPAVAERRPPGRSPWQTPHARLPRPPNLTPTA